MHIPDDLPTVKPSKSNLDLRGEIKPEEQALEVKVRAKTNELLIPARNYKAEQYQEAREFRKELRELESRPVVQALIEYMKNHGESIFFEKALVSRDMKDGSSPDFDQVSTKWNALILDKRGFSIAKAATNDFFSLLRQGHRFENPSSKDFSVKESATADNSAPVARAAQSFFSRFRKVDAPVIQIREELLPLLENGLKMETIVKGLNTAIDRYLNCTYGALEGQRKFKLIA